MVNWELKSCCDHEQVVFLVTVGVFTVVILALWRTVLLTPFKLITVFLHETSHALACKLTCGQVEGIQVHANEGGVTHTRGGIYWVILPAGYLGSSFWGMVLILASTNLLTARIAAGCFAVALLIVLFVAKNWLLRGLCIGFIIFLAIIWVLQETTKIHILRYVILFIGKDYPFHLFPVLRKSTTFAITVLQKESLTWWRIICLPLLMIYVGLPCGESLIDLSHHVVNTV
eukprot:TRINITY_DN2115_c3_g1_i3.p1 TRINITY_DN2115_c3_g1~~TRINITY_DN2115_c3_g1_i3.p1  ORF type:complete len:230 (-),score=5.11 TRINITY_DN2115_c3_g1_i3:119-808(-)